MTFLYRDTPLRHPQVNGRILRIYLAFLGLTKGQTGYNLYRIFYPIIFGTKLA
jgi:hypothetical protein